MSDWMNRQIRFRIYKKKKTMKFFDALPLYHSSEIFFFFFPQVSASFPFFVLTTTSASIFTFGSTTMDGRMDGCLIRTGLATPENTQQDGGGLGVLSVSSIDCRDVNRIASPPKKGTRLNSFNRTDPKYFFFLGGVGYLSTRRWLKMPTMNRNKLRTCYSNTFWL